MIETPHHPSCEKYEPDAIKSLWSEMARLRERVKALEQAAKDAWIDKELYAKKENSK